MMPVKDCMESFVAANRKHRQRESSKGSLASRVGQYLLVFSFQSVSATREVPPVQAAADASAPSWNLLEKQGARIPLSFG